jgi:adenosylmethionine-8-amino-7-oxononanoate aminotransferase
MDVMRGFEERREGARLAGVENLMLHFTPNSEYWSKLPVIVSGKGCYVTNDKGRSYVDGLAVLFTMQVGNGRTEISEAAAGQIKDLGFFPNWSFQHPNSVELAEKLAQIAPGDLDTSFFVSSGSEAVETAIKLARQHHKANGDAERYKVISRKVAYHGGTRVNRIGAPLCLKTRWSEHIRDIPATEMERVHHSESRSPTRCGSGVRAEPQRCR